MKCNLLPIAVCALIFLSAPVLHAQADVYSSTFLILDEESYEIHGYFAMITTYDVLFYYEAAMDTTLLLRDGKNLDVSSVNSSDDEYLIAEVGAPAVPGATIRISTRIGVSPYYHNRSMQAYDVFNFQYWSTRGVSRRNYAHFIGKGPAHFIVENDSAWPSDAEKPAPGSLIIEVQKGKAWLGGGSVVLDKIPTTLTRLTAKGMAGTGKLRWTAGPKLKVIGSAKGPQICVRGLSRSDTKGDTSVSLIFVSRTGKKQTATVAFTVREPISLTRFGIGVETR